MKWNETWNTARSWARTGCCLSRMIVSLSLLSHWSSSKHIVYISSRYTWRLQGCNMKEGANLMKLCLAERTAHICVAGAHSQCTHCTDFFMIAMPNRHVLQKQKLSCWESSIMTVNLLLDHSGCFINRWIYTYVNVPAESEYDCWAGKMTNDTRVHWLWLMGTTVLSWSLQSSDGNRQDQIRAFYITISARPRAKVLLCGIGSYLSLGNKAQRPALLVCTYALLSWE